MYSLSLPSPLSEAHTGHYKASVWGWGEHFSNTIKMNTKIILGAKNLTVCNCRRGVIRIVSAAPVYIITRSLELGSGAG